jgi:hypothetical protein
MKVDVTEKLVSMEGCVIKDTDGNGNAIDATVKLAIVNALLSPVQSEKGVDKIKKYELAKKVYASDEVDLDENEIKLIKERVGDLYTPLIVGRIFELLKV